MQRKENFVSGYLDRNYERLLVTKMKDEIILVDIYDNEVGIMEKMKAHRKPVLHRAFSVFLISNNKMLIQRRAFNKYHSGGLWANACCSHPRKGERLEEAIHRRLMEELGIDAELKEIGSFVYCSKYADDLYEYEYDHVFIGEFNGRLFPNKDEIDEIKWIDVYELSRLLQTAPEMFATWFLTACPIVLKNIKEQEKNQ